MFRINCLEPTYKESIFLSTFSNVWQHLGLALFLTDGKPIKSRVNKFKQLLMLFVCVQFDSEFNTASLSCLNLSLTSFDLDYGTFRKDGLSLH